MTRAYVVKLRPMPASAPPSLRLREDEDESVPVPVLVDEGWCARGGEGETRDENRSWRCAWSGE
jgi:hypothetical protein